MPQQDHLTARLVVDDDFEVAPVNNRLFGSFVEHLGRCVYTGIYEPDHPASAPSRNVPVDSIWPGIPPKPTNSACTRWPNGLRPPAATS